MVLGQESIGLPQVKVHWKKVCLASCINNTNKLSVHEKVPPLKIQFSVAFYYLNLVTWSNQPLQLNNDVTFLYEAQYYDYIALL